MEQASKMLKADLYSHGTISRHRGLFIKNLGRVIALIQNTRFYRNITGNILYRNIDFKYTSEITGYKFAASQGNREIAKVYLQYSETDAFPGWWIRSLGVRVFYRRLGIGKRLINKLIDFARNQGVHVLYLNVCKEETIAFKLYKSLGFSAIPLTKRIDKNSGCTFIYMQLDLNEHKDC